VHYQLPQATTSPREFEFEVKRLADSLQFGSDPSRFIGSGLEYAESRPYEPGDPVKSMDWRVTARMGKPFVKTYEASRQVPVYLIVDTSASMCVGSQEPTKYQWAVRLAAALARASQERMSAVGLVAVGERDLRVTPTLSSSEAMRWAHQLRTYDFKEATRLSDRLRTLAASMKTHSLVILLTDLHEPAAFPALELVAASHEVLVFWLEDPAENDPPPSGFFRGREAETDKRFFLGKRTRLSNHERIRNALVDGGIEFLHLPIGEPVLPKVRHFLRHRKSMGHV
jgi:uncharacterized protein (DUF58 family)